MANNRKIILERLLAFLAALSVLICCCTIPAAAAEEDEAGGGSVSAEAEEEEEDSDGGWGFGLLDWIKSSFTEMFVNTFNDWISGIVNACYALVDELMLDLLDITFHVETLVNSGETTVFSADALQDVYRFLYTLASSLVVLKFLIKGFQIYILWRGGDADQSPRDMLMGVAQAAVVMVSFPFLYDLLVDVVLEAAQELMGKLGAMQYNGGIVDILLSNIGGMTWPRMLVFLLLALIFFILVLVLWIKMIAQGFELLVLRLGVPLATLGLIDSDMALFKNYMQLFVKTALTAVIQACLMSLAFRVIGTFRILNVVSAIALIYTAMSTPKLLQQFLVPRSPGGGIAQKAYSAAMVARAAKMLFV